MVGVSRRAHRKSRGGCTRCKSKKVKCDEQRPCTYCAKRDLACSLLSEAPTSSDHNPIASSRPREIPAFTLSDFELFHFFTKTTAIIHTDDEEGTRRIWQEVIPSMATQHQYLLHEILAVTAMHLSLERPDDAKELRHIGAMHQSRAIPLFSEALKNLSEESALPLYSCACLVVPYFFVAATEPYSLFVDEDKSAPPQWFSLLEGCAMIHMRYPQTLFESPLRPLLGDMFIPTLDCLPDFPTDRRLLDMREALPYDSAEQRAAYIDVVDKLRISFAKSDSATTLVDTRTAALSFPPHVGPSFTQDLTNRRPAALVVVAFWCVLLSRFEEAWWLRGRVKPLLLKVEELLPLEHRSLIEWPKEQLRMNKVPLWVASKLYTVI
ncbi:hypothetical protein F4778DRAFT_43919 [Xylariomycetidae sp. FL2044]|nr:hypothetical protein F4778DRAFT_43919 [Xylariomycetidae sp. FL2044]